MHFNVGFSDRKINQNYFEILLPLAFNYCKNYFDGNVYVYKDNDVSFKTIVNYLLSKRNIILNIGNIRLNKQTDALLCLLVNPYFDELIEFLKINSQNLPKHFVNLLKNQIFKHLANEETFKKYQISYMEGAKFYNEHLCYQKAKDVLCLLN